SRFAARDCPSRTIRNRVLPHRLVALRRCRSCAWRIFPDSRPVAGSTIVSTDGGNESSARNNSVSAAVSVTARSTKRRRSETRRYNPHAPHYLVILNRNRVHFFWLLGLFARSWRHEGAGPAQCKAEQDDRDVQCQRH